MRLLNFPQNFLTESVISVRPVLQSKYTPRYFILLTQCIGGPNPSVPQTEGPPKVISWLFVGLNRMSHAVRYCSQMLMSL